MDPRGPIRQVVSVEMLDGWTWVTKSCGHCGKHANHFHYKVGTDIRCFKCRKQEEEN